ncbi:hypothetical protein [Phenylobacterium sp.]|uniref:hypothetical protein n=1 Tax=Phenylobacterium sp. TaxID=1871053 RepID=UPI002F927F64
MSWLAAFRRPLPAFAAASALAVGVGAAVCALSGVPEGVWGRNLAAWLVGALAAMALSRFAGVRTLAAVALVAPLGVAAAMLFDGQQGVHRWLGLGPVYINAAMLLLPPLVVAVGALAERWSWWWMPALLTLAVLVLQPDASQASALALAICVAGFSTSSARVKVGIALGATALAALSWTRPDPLAPVPEVEEVIGLAARQSPWLAGLAVLALAAFAVTPALSARGTAARSTGYALSALFLFWSLAPALGAFPVPLVGMGLSPILGAWLGVGLLAATMRARTEPGAAAEFRRGERA